MKVNKICHRDVTPRKIIVYGLGLGLLLTFLSVIFTGGESFFLLLHSDPKDSFMDFFNSIYDALFRNPYESRNVIYPPLTYLYYHVCGSFMDTSIKPPMEWRNGQQGIMVYLAITFVTVAVLHYIFRCKKEEQTEDRCFPSLLLFATAPFWYTYERGNLILQALLFLALFVRFYDSPNAVLRELALISLAISSSFKIYPAVFGLLLIRDKKFWAAFRCILYGAVIFFLPFLFFGSFSSIGLMISNLSHTNQLFNGLGYGYKVNLLNTINFITELTVNPRHIRSAVFLTVGLCIAVTIFLSRERWQFMTALASAVILLPGFSYTYTLIFMAVPLWDFYQNSDKNKKSHWIASVLFLLMFMPIPFGGSNPFELPEAHYQLGLTTAVSSVALVGMVLFLAVDSVISYVGILRNKHSKIQD